MSGSRASVTPGAESSLTARGILSGTVGVRCSACDFTEGFEAISAGEDVSGMSAAVGIGVTGAVGAMTTIERSLTRFSPIVAETSTPRGPQSSSVAPHGSMKRRTVKVRVVVDPAGTTTESLRSASVSMPAEPRADPDPWRNASTCERDPGTFF